jgi:hypothetical protein
MTDEIAALTARIASMQAEIWSLREANAYPALIRRHACVEQRERCAKMLEDEAREWGRDGVTKWVESFLQAQAAAIRALGDE